MKRVIYSTIIFCCSPLLCMDSSNRRPELVKELEASAFHADVINIWDDNFILTETTTAFLTNLKKNKYLIISSVANTLNAQMPRVDLPFPCCLDEEYRKPLINAQIIDEKGYFKRPDILHAIFKDKKRLLNILKTVPEISAENIQIKTVDKEKDQNSLEKDFVVFEE